MKKDTNEYSKDGGTYEESLKLIKMVSHLSASEVCEPPIDHAHYDEEAMAFVLGKR